LEGIVSGSTSRLVRQCVDEPKPATSLECARGRVDAIPVPVHGNQPIKKGTLGNILRTAGLSREQFNRLL
jgi:hypothetical protein